LPRSRRKTRPRRSQSSSSANDPVALGLVASLAPAGRQPHAAGAPAAPPALPDKPSIAVLPFAKLSGDPGQDYLTDGLTDNLLDALAQNPGLFVIARNATLVYRGKVASPITSEYTRGALYE
jgi:adenylate cyclase